MSSRLCWAPAAVALTVAACASPKPDLYHELRAAAAEHEHPDIHLGEDDGADPFDGAEELSREALIEAALLRNLHIEANRQAVLEALAAVPEAVTLDDPMLSYSIAPLSPFDRDVRFGQEIMLSQRLPWPGKRRARGEAATARAEASQSDYLVAKLDFALAAARLYDDYPRVTRTLEINEVHLDLLEDAQASARAEFEAGRATLQDPLQAEVEAAHLRHRQLALRGELDELIARINGLLHRRQDHPLPPPAPRQVPAPIRGSLQRLIAEALETRAELTGREAEMRAEQASLDEARRDYYPDIGVSASYNNMWDHLSHQLMVGLSLNLPVWRGARAAGVDRAQARLERARLLRDHASAEITAEVVASHRRVEEGFHVVHHYRNQIIPASEDRVDAAHAGFLAGELSFYAVIDALRALRTHELEYEEHLATLYQRLAALERAAGRIPGLRVVPGDQETLHGH